MGDSQQARVYPPVAFHFKVMFDSSGEDTSFQEVSGISSEIEVESVVEGGENRFVHQLPVSVKHSNLELKRGLASLDSPLVKWCKETMERDFIKPIETRSVNVYLMDEKHQPIRGWRFESAYPVKWEIESFNSTKNEVAIEKIVLSFSYSTRIEQKLPKEA